MATVIPLPLPRPVPGGPCPEWADHPTVGVLGFVHPGKGHADVIDAAGGVRVVAAGGPAPGHDDLVRELHRRAERRGVELVVTGPLDEAGMTAAARAVTVAVVPGAAVSASGSLMTWLGTGRRPLVARGEYATELDRRHPGAVTLYDDAAALPSAIGRGLADPGGTHLDRAPDVPDAGAAHAALYRGLLAC